MNHNIIMEKLEEAADGLMFQSESDYPVEAFFLEIAGKDSIIDEDILQIGNYPPDTSVTLVNFDDFFKVPTREQSWHGEEEKETVKRFQELVRILNENLRDIKVFKIGEIEIDVYVIGKADSDNFLGIKTKVVET